MDLTAYLLDGVVNATSPPNETEAAARSRRDAIVEMLRAFDPSNAMEAMIACHCVMLQFLLNAAMRDASNIYLEPAVVARNRVGAISISRTLHQWVTKLETVKKRNEARAAEAREAAQIEAAAVPLAETAAMKSPVQRSPDAPVRPSHQPSPLTPDRLAIRAPLPNGRASAAVIPPDNFSPPAVGSQSRASG